MNLLDAFVSYEMTCHSFISLALKGRRLCTHNSLNLKQDNLCHIAISSRNFSKHTVLLHKLNARNNNKSLIRRVRTDDRIKSNPFHLPFCTRVNNLIVKRMFVTDSHGYH